MAYNKIIYNGTTLIDLTGDDVTPQDVAYGKKFHKPDGTDGVGTSTKDADTQDATANASEILATKTAYVRGTKVTGAMPNNGAVVGAITSTSAPYTVPAGYHDGSGTVDIESTEKAKIVPGNIREGVEILGVTGTLTPETPVTVEQNRNVTPSASQQVVTPASGYDYLAQVTVLAIPYTETANSAGGITVTIG